MKEPLKAVDGAIALPANTELLTEVHSFSEHSQMSQRTNIWFLPAGTSVEIYVNQAIQF